MVGYGLSNDMFMGDQVQYYNFDGNANGAPKDHQFRLLPAFAPGKLFHKFGKHWGYVDASGARKPVICGLESFGTCPICDDIKAKKGLLQQVEAALATEFDPMNRQTLEQQKAALAEEIAAKRRKPAVLWNIRTEDGVSRVAELSWNAHESLHTKVKTLFSMMQIDPTNLQRNVLMWCQRSGKMAQTRFTFEMLPNCEKDLTAEVKQITNLEQLNDVKTIDYLQMVVEQNMIPSVAAAPEVQPQMVAQPIQTPAAPQQPVMPQAQPAINPATLTSLPQQPVQPEQLAQYQAPAQPVQPQQTPVQVQQPVMPQQSIQPAVQPQVAVAPQPVQVQQPVQPAANPMPEQPVQPVQQAVQPVHTPVQPVQQPVQLEQPIQAPQVPIEFTASQDQNMQDMMAALQAK